MRALSKLIGALGVLALVLAFGSPAGGPAAARDAEAVAGACDDLSTVGIKGDRCIHKLCRELLQVEKLARRCLKEEAKERDKRDVKHLRVIIKHLEEAIRECRRADKD